MRTVVKIVLINDRNEILLNLRDVDHPENPNVWALPGGGVDPGESEEEALVREVKEEINYNLKEYKKLKEIFLDAGKRVFYFGKIDVEISELKVGEGQEIKFFTYEETKKLKINKLHQDILKEIFEKSVPEGIRTLDPSVSSRKTL